MEKNQYQVEEIFAHSHKLGQENDLILTEHTASALFIIIWGVMRQAVKRLVAYREICRGANPWEEKMKNGRANGAAMLIEGAVASAENGIKLTDDTAKSLLSVVDGVKQVSETVGTLSIRSNASATIMPFSLIFHGPLRPMIPSQARGPSVKKTASF